MTAHNAPGAGRQNPELIAEYVVIRRGNVDALLKLIDDRWTSPETVLKRIRETFWSARRHADHGLFSEEAEWFRQAVEEYDQRMALLCENCGKAMIEHDGLAHCWPERGARIDGSKRSEGPHKTSGPAVGD